MRCKECAGGEYPHYGLAPHGHNAALGNTGFVARDRYPDNFEPDLDDDGQEMPIGTYYCPTPGCDHGIDKLGLRKPIN